MTPSAAATPLRVLHLVETAAGDEALLAAAAAATIPLAEHTLILLADSVGERRAHALGIATPDRVTPAGPITARRLASLLRTRLEGEHRPTVLTAWSMRTLELARRSLGKRAVPRIGVLVTAENPSPNDAYALDEATVLALSPALRDAISPASAARRGGSPSLIRDNIRLAPPPVFNRAGPIPTEREAVRAALGLDPADRVVGLLSGIPAHADALAMAFQLGLCFTIGRPLIGLVDRGAANLRQGLEFCREHGRRWSILPDNLTLPERIAAADLCIAQMNGPRPSCGPTALSLAAAMGVPVAAHPGVIAGLGSVAHPPPALLGSGNDRNALALPILALADTDRERPSIAHAQRAWCDHARVADAFRTTLADLWAEVANLPMPRPGLPTPAALIGAGA